MNISEKMKHDWEQRAQHHSRFWIATEHYHTEEIFAQSGHATAESLLEALRGLQQPSWKVLDIGCGIGRVLKPLAKYFDTLVGIDVSSTMIAQSKAWLAECPHVATYETSGVDLCEFSDQSFDLVYSYVAFQHMPKPVFENYLGEINRVLTPKGYLALQVPIGPSCDVSLEDTIGIRSYSRLEIISRLQNNGLEFLDYTDFEHSPTHDVQPFDHRFHLAQKFQPITQKLPVHWRPLEQPNQPSPLDILLYETFADNCVKFGKLQEGIQTLQSLVHRNPEHLAGWLKLSALLLETRRVQEALSTMQQFTAAHPHYQEGQVALQRLLATCKKANLSIPHQAEEQKSNHETPNFSSA